MKSASRRRRRPGLPARWAGALLGAWLAAAPAPLRAASDYSSSAIGTAGSEFLLFDLGARGIGMGGAYSSVTDDAYSLYWNPAGLAKIPRLSAATMYSIYIQDISYQSLSYAQRLNDNSVAAAGFRYMNAGSVAHTDTTGNPVGQGTFQPRNYVAEAGWGQAVYDLSDSEVDIDLGVAARWIHTDMVERANGYGGDAGVQAHIYNNYLPYDLSAVVQNVGIGQKFDRTRDTLPSRVRFGGAVRPRRGLILSVEGIMPVNNAPAAAAGCEYTWEVDKTVKAMVRGGFNSSTIEDVDIMSGMNLGLGLTVADFTFDYAFTPMGLLGTATHRLSVSFNLPAKLSHRYRER
ncbi:MAG: PorV/PorQ family protein [Elusimicrobia bacterium]|nr:PorV/PorQ family protein [Elusimicrobiota bacterium]